MMDDDVNVYRNTEQKRLGEEVDSRDSWSAHDSILQELLGQPELASMPQLDTLLMQAKAVKEPGWPCLTMQRQRRLSKSISVGVRSAAPAHRARQDPTQDDAVGLGR